MSLDINDSTQSTVGGRYINMLFRDGIATRFPAKDGLTKVLVMPAFADRSAVTPEQWPTSYQAYRLLSDPERFSQWAVSYNSYTLIAGRLNLFDPATLDPTAINPMAALLQVANSTPQFYHLVNKDQNGAKLKGEGVGPAQLPAASGAFAMNCVEINARKPEDEGISRVFNVKRTAFKPQHARGQVSTGEWGLLSALGIKNRGIEDAAPTDFDRVYYWGDITNPNKLIACQVGKVTPPSGGMRIFNMVPTTDKTTYQATAEMLESRTELTGIFAQNEPAAVIEVLADLFGDYPELLRRAFERSYPGIDNLLRQSGVTSHARVHQAGTEFGQRVISVEPPTPQPTPAFVPQAVAAAPQHLPTAAMVFTPAASGRPVRQPDAPAAPVHVPSTTTTSSQVPKRSAADIRAALTASDTDSQ